MNLSVNGLMLDNISIEFIGIGFACLVVLALFYLMVGKEKYPYFSRKTLLTPTELKFYKTLLAIRDSSHQHFSSPFEIALQVRLADIINCTSSHWHKGYGPQISAKHIDFVLFDPHTTEIKLCIELDDRSHERPDRKRRDIFVNKALHAAHVPLMRISTKDMYNQKLIVETIKKRIL